MTGNRAGGLKVKEANLARDPNFYKKIGAIGGKKSTGGGFASASKEQVSAWGKKGGTISKRKPRKG